jgi:hypothetical protein
MLNAAWEAFFHAMGQPHSPLQQDAQALRQTTQHVKERLQAQLRAMG